MAVSTPLSPSNRPDMKMPMPPPLLHTRSGNEVHDRPQTPNQNGFTSPFQTPTGSPSKKQLPPGANDLPNVFENAMKLAPMSPSKSQPQSPTKQGLSLADENITRDPFSESANHNAIPGSPTRKPNKENTAPGGYLLGKSPGIQQNQAAISRQEAYQQTESKKNPAQTRGLTAEELQKLQLPRVKRLANVTQLCKKLHSIWFLPQLTNV
jgi:cell cycle protein kinase DBF2